MKTRNRVTVVAAALAALVAVAGCSGTSSTTSSSKGDAIGVDFPRSDSDFWNSYNEYIPKYGTEFKANLLSPTNSQNDVGKLAANVSALKAKGAKAIIMAPQDTGAVVNTIKTLNAAKIPVVSVDTRPDAGNVYMVVRADNKAYGEKACKFLGDQLKGTGKVAEFMGALSSVNGRDRSEAFASCMKKNYPGIKVFALATEWDGATASSKLQTVLRKEGSINGIYMQAGGVFLAPTLQLLKGKGMLVPPSDPKHISIISNDGIPQEFDAIRKGQIDATVSQPADLYSKYGVFYAKAAVDGKTFKPGPTDHDSTIIQVRAGMLEDQLPAPLVTKENVDDKSLWGNQVK